MNMRIYNFLRGCKHILMIPWQRGILLDAKWKKQRVLAKKKGKIRGPIKVGFIVQMPEVWDKEAPLFEAMLDDDRFAVTMIIVPHYDFAASRLNEYGEEKRYFTEKYPNVCTVLLKDEADMVIDGSFDYVFYQRCWEEYLPRQLRCNNVIRYALTCYVPYCYHCAPDPTAYYQTDFFLYLNKFYCCSKDQFEQVSSIRGAEGKYLGYPVIDSLRYDAAPHSSCNVLWTPRWTDDPDLGGTSFIRNHEEILGIQDIDDRINLILRPHPLTFENALKQGWMSESEIEAYKRKVIESGASFDKNKIIEDTFLDTNIMITDFSSAIITFFYSGRPIIFCSDHEFPMIDAFKDIIGACYLAKDCREISTVLKELIQGNDVLYDRRQEVIQRIYNRGSSVDNIMRDLVETLN